MALDFSTVIIIVAHIGLLSFGYGMLWNQVKMLRDLVLKIETMIDGIVLTQINDHESRIKVIEAKHELCDRK